MFRFVPMPEPTRSIPLLGQPSFTHPLEVRFLIWLAAQSSGAILEIGCHMGQTTLELALAFPRREIIAVDYVLADDTMSEGQRYEKPEASLLCVGARSLPNVRVLNQKSSTLDYNKLGRIGFVYIDGDHSYSGVKADSENALEYFSRQEPGLDEPRFIVWHDVEETHPAWVEVLPYLQNEIAPRHEVMRVEQTWLAYLKV